MNFNICHQKKQEQGNSKRISYSSDKDSRIAPTKSTKPSKIFSHSGQSKHISAHGYNRRNVNFNEEEEVFGIGSTRNACTVGLRKQRSCWNSTNAAHLSRFSNSVAGSGGSGLDMSGGDSSVSSLWPDDRFVTRYLHSHIGIAGESNYPLLDASKSSHKKDFHPFLRRPAIVRNLFTDINIYNDVYIFASRLYSYTTIL